MKMTQLHNRRTSQGFTLVEIMVAITLSLVLIGGLVQVYASNKKSSLIQSNLADMQESQRLALSVLTRDIRMAGYYDGNDPNNVQDVDRFDASNTQDGGVDNGDPLPDTITVKYESTKDCLGQDIDASEASNLDDNNNTIAINKYFVQNQILYCLGNGGDNPEPIADNIANMQILYGENTNAVTPFAPPGNKYADRYVLPATADLNKVVSVRIALLVMTPNAVKDQEEERTYQLLDAPGLTFKNKNRYEVVTTTVALRNFNQ
jgi:type IV pilus assembly protein PilW